MRPIVAEQTGVGRHWRRLSGAMLCCLAAATSPVWAQSVPPSHDWPTIGADGGSSKYSPLEQINRENVHELKVAWQWTSIDERIQRENPDNRFIARATYFQCTPLMIGGVLFGSTCLGQAMAVDAVSGDTLWSYDSESYKAGRPPQSGLHQSRRRSPSGRYGGPNLYCNEQFVARLS